MKWNNLNISKLNGMVLSKLNGVDFVFYLIKDNFLTADANPIASPRAMEPGPGNWTTRDVEGKIAIADGWAEWTAQATAAYADQDMVCKDIPIIRAAGQIIMCKWRCATDEAHFPLALVDAQEPVWDAGGGDFANVIHGFRRSAALTLSSIDNELASVPLMPFVADGTEYWLMMVLQDEGCYYFAQGGAFTELTFLRFSEVGTATPLYVASAGNAAVFSTTKYRVPMSPYTGLLVAEA